MILKRRADLQARKAFIDGLMNDAKKAQEEAKMYQGERDRAVAEMEKERLSKSELSENITTTAHHIKSPTTSLGKLSCTLLLAVVPIILSFCFLSHSINLETLLIHPLSHTLTCTDLLGLAVDSLLCALDNNKPLSQEARSRVIETLHGIILI